MKSSIAARFSAAASTYHELAAVQVKAAKRLMEIIGNHGAPARILEIGCGTGVLTALLARAFPSAQIDAVDISPAMSAQARKNLAKINTINWIVADARHLAPAAKYPLIASNCALHWITPLDPVLATLADALADEGRLAIAMMTRGTLAELSESRKRIAPLKSPRTHLPAEADIRGAFAGAGLRVISEKSETIRHHYASAKEMIRHLHAQGLTGGNGSAGGKLLTRSELLRLMDDYESHYKSYEGVFASYCLYCCVAGKKKTLS